MNHLFELAVKYESLFHEPLPQLVELKLMAGEERAILMIEKSIETRTPVDYEEDEASIKGGDD